MQLNVSTDIALRTLMYVAERNAPVTIREIATACGVAKSHLMKVVMQLVAAGILNSSRGRNGGVYLAKAPAAISVGEVVRLMEQNLSLLKCMKGSTACPILSRCKLKNILSDAQHAFFDKLDQTSLSDILIPATPATDHMHPVSY